MNLKKEKFIFDFDGTITNVAEEAKDYPNLFSKRLADMAGIPFDIFNPLMQQYMQEVRNDANVGWTMFGKIVAPAQADLYVLAEAGRNRLLDAYHRGEIEELKGYKIPDNINKLAFQLFNEISVKLPTVFNEGAAELLNKLKQDSGGIVVVTNSKTDKVYHKLDLLGVKDIEVIGDAKKYVITAEETMYLPGLDRPIYTQRGKYVSVLEDLAREKGFNPEQTTIVGDIYEFDLMPAEVTGKPYGLVLTNEANNAAKHELQHLETLRNARVIQHIGELLDN